MKSCSSFCTNKCEGDHHKLLLSLFQLKCKETFSQFKQLLRVYRIHGFRIENGIPDSRPNFRYPLLHWAAVLGQAEVVEMLLKAPYNVSPRLTTDHNQETPLHRLLDVMDRTLKPQSILTIVELLHDSLDCVDAIGNTPFHACAEALVSCSKVSFFLSFFQFTVAWENQVVIQIYVSKFCHTHIFMKMSIF